MSYCVVIFSAYPSVDQESSPHQLNIMSDKKTASTKAPAKVADKAPAKAEKPAAKVEKAPAVKPETTTPVDESKPATRSFGGRIPAVDKKSYDDKIDTLDAELKTLIAKQQTMNKTISDKSGGKEEFFRQRDEVKAKLDANQKTLNDLDAAKTKVQESIQTKQKAGHETLAEINSMKKTIGFSSEAEVDRKIADIEYQMQTESLSLKRERELMAEISKFKQMKPQIQKMKNMSVGVAGDDSVGGLRVELASVQKQIAEARDEKRKIQAAYSKIMDARKKAMEGVSDLVEGRDELYQKIKKTQEELRKTKDEKFKKIRDFQAQIAEAKVARADREKIEKVFKDAEGARRKIEDELINENTLPNEEKVELAENVIQYCVRLLPAEEKVEEKKHVELKQLPGTSQVFLRKEDRAEEFFYAPTKAKKTATVAKKDEVKSFTHTLAVLGLFASLKIDAPLAPAQVQKTIDALKAKISTIKADQVKVVAERKARRSEREAALVEATKTAEAAKAEWLKVAPHDE